MRHIAPTALLDSILRVAEFKEMNALRLRYTRDERITFLGRCSSAQEAANVVDVTGETEEMVAR